MSQLLARMSIANRNGNPKDGVSFALTFAGTGTTSVDAGNAAAALQDLFNASTLGFPNLGSYLSHCLEPTADIRVYDLTGHLDGSPHGSPVFELPAAAITRSGVGSNGNQLAMCVAYHADLSSVVENGPIAPIPTPEQGIDWGAPVTHFGTTKPRASRRGRMFIGPIQQDMIVLDGNANPSIDASDAMNVAGALNAWSTGDVAGRSLAWTIWSRRLAALHTVQGGWVDQAIATVRRREFRTPDRQVYTAV